MASEISNNYGATRYYTGHYGFTKNTLWYDVPEVHIPDGDPIPGWTTRQYTGGLAQGSYTLTTAGFVDVLYWVSRSAILGSWSFSGMFTVYVSTVGFYDSSTP
ncbi:MAG: hypothetical protein AB1750_17375, partial [Chloroflexota bacterium]